MRLKKDVAKTANKMPNPVFVITFSFHCILSYHTLPKGYTLGKQSFVKLKYQFLSISIEDCAFFCCSLKEEANVPSKLKNNWTQIIKNSYLTKF